NLISFPAEKINRHIKNLNKTVATTELIARELAKKLIGNIPIIYSTAKWQTISKIWKINFNENSKIPSFYNIFPELCHNELVGFTQPLTKFTTIILKDNSDHLENQKRMLAFAEVMKKSAHPIIIDIPEGSIIEKIMQMLLLGSLTSYYLALEYKINPAPVKMVETFKKLL
ncbi:MAG: SIS domain-containing protein, partial [Patescibacteria group bacterium]